jgi:hypothetical protein
MHGIASKKFFIKKDELANINTKQILWNRLKFFVYYIINLKNKDEYEQCEQQNYSRR